MTFYAVETLPVTDDVHDSDRRHHDRCRSRIQTYFKPWMVSRRHHRRLLPLWHRELPFTASVVSEITAPQQIVEPRVVEIPAVRKLT